MLRIIDILVQTIFLNTETFPPPQKRNPPELYLYILYILVYIYIPVYTMVYIYMCRACLILQCRSAFEQSSVRIWLRRKIIPYSVNLYTVQCTVYTVITTYSRVDLIYLCTVKYQVKDDKRREVTNVNRCTVRNRRWRSFSSSTFVLIDPGKSKKILPLTTVLNLCFEFYQGILNENASIPECTD